MATTTSNRAMSTMKSNEKDVKRKRRLSRKEQKALKKQKKKNALKEQHPTLDTTTTATSSLKKNASQETTTTMMIERTAEPTRTIQDFQSTYIPTELPPSHLDFDNDNTKSTTSLGKWFPKAKVLKSKRSFTNAETTKAKASLLLFYQYAKWDDNNNTTVVRRLLWFLEKIAKHRTLGGRIRVAPEGVNATVSSVDNVDDDDDDSSSTAMETLRHFALDLQRFDSKTFAQTDFKFIDQLGADRHFKDLKLLPVKELVFYGLGEKEAPLEQGGIHVPPTKFHQMLEQKDAVVIDVRNHYEAAIGRFDGQEEQQQQQDDDVSTTGEKKKQKGGATYLDPKMRKSTDFPEWLQKTETQEQLRDKKVLMFCTGGVRCERASALLKKTLNKEDGVFQLQGGIERYLQQFPDGGYWRGKNFVFDKREAISASNPNGDGGVVVSSSSSNTDDAASSFKKRPRGQRNTIDGARCCICNKPWDRYIGKKKCDMCGVPVLMCTTCMTTQSSSKKVKQQHQQKDRTVAIKCPLCIEQNVTVPASQVDLTDNGVHASVPKKKAKDGDAQQQQQERAAPSVLKWGGGHGKNRKLQRKASKRLCQFGSMCTRKDCMFSHPEQQQQGNGGSA